MNTNCTPEPDTPDGLDSRNTEGMARDAQLGDQRAFTELYLRCVPSVRRSACARLGGRWREVVHDVDDLIQETFADAFRKIHTGEFDPDISEGRLRNLLARILRNKVADRRRRLEAEKRGGGRERLLSDSVPESAGESRLPPGTIPTPSESASSREEEERLHAALQKLREEERTLIDLKEFCGMTCLEIAQELGKTEVAVRLAAMRARRRLASMLGRRT